MSFVAEVPGETNPLSRQNVYRALVSAAGTTQQQVLTGGTQLQNWESEAGYHASLQDVFVDYSLPLEVRYLAIIQLKNGIDKYWRKTAPNALSPEEKMQIKGRALEAGVTEPEPRLALHNALMIAKILRYEFPADWPDAITSIVQALRMSSQPGANSVHLPRTLLIMLNVIKELSTAKLLRIRKSLEAATPEVLGVLTYIYMAKVEQWSGILETGNGDEATAIRALEVSLLCLKSMRRLMISGFDQPNRDSFVQGVWSTSMANFGSFYSFLRSGSPLLTTNTQSMLEKHLVQLSKLHIEMARNHPAAFVLLPDCIKLVLSYWNLVVELGQSYTTTDLSNVKEDDNDDEKNVLLEKLGLKGLLIMRACVRLVFYPVHTFRYQRQLDKEEKALAVKTIETQLLTEPFVTQVMELLVTRFFIMRAGDLREWAEEPEEWERHEEESVDAFEFSVRSCAEKLFLDVTINFKESLSPKLLQVFYSYATPDNREVLLKDSIYSAIGLAAPCLEKQVDFNSFLLSTLIPEVQIRQSGYNILRRRIAILLGQWYPIKPQELDGQAVCQVFQHLLNKADPVNDQVVRVTAGRQLKNILDTLEFTAEGFLPYIRPILTSLVELIEEMSLIETKMSLLETVRVVVVKMEDHISPFTDQIMSLLPPLWEQSGDEFLMKQAILSLLSSIIHSMKQESVRYHPIIIPLIQNSVEPGSESLTFLLDEALELWSAVLTEAPTSASPALVTLLPSLFTVFDASTDSTRQALVVAESYILLAPRDILGEGARSRLLTTLTELLALTTKQQLGVVPHLAELLIRAVEFVDFETGGGGNEQAYTFVARSLLESGFLPTLLGTLRDTYAANQTTGPRRVRPPVSGVIETDYFSVLARLALASPRVFVDAVSAAPLPASKGSEKRGGSDQMGEVDEERSTPVLGPTLNWLLVEWFAHFDSIGDINRKKLHALALTRLLGINNAPEAGGSGAGGPPPPFLAVHLQSYLTVWTDLLVELLDGADEPGDPRAGDYLIFTTEADADPVHDDVDGAVTTSEAPETGRRRRWTVADAVHTVNMRAAVAATVSGLVAAAGGVEGFAGEGGWLSSVDKEVVRGFAELRVM